MILEPIKAYFSSIDNIAYASSIVGYIKILKYICVAIGVLATALDFIYRNIRNQRRIKNNLFYFEFSQLIIVILAFSLISVFYILKSHKSTPNTIQELLQLIIPAGIAFMVINYLSFREIYNLFSFGLIYSLIFYFFTIGPYLFNFSYLIRLNLFDSTSSVFEVHEFAVFANAYIAFFTYFRKKSRLLFVIAFIYNLLTFKRVYVLFSIVFLLLSVLKKDNIKIKRHVVVISKIMTIVLTIGFHYFLQPENWVAFEKIFHVSIGKLTMYRSNRIQSYLVGFQSYGFGSVNNEVLRGYLELDLIKILMETSIIGLVIFVSCYWNLTGLNLFCYFIVLNQFINMFFSWTLGRPYKWAIILITIGCIIYKKRNQDVKSLLLFRGVSKKG